MSLATGRAFLTMDDTRQLSDLSNEGKLYYSISEVAAMLGENASLIRFWEKQFTGIRPKRNAKGNRIYTREQIIRLKSIHHLVKVQGMTLHGAREALNASSDGIDKETELRDSLLKLKEFLLDLRKNL